MQSDSDSVIHRYQRGEQSAFRELLEPHEPALRARIGRRMAPLLRRRISVQDVFQEVAIVAFEQRGAFTGNTPDEFRRWISGIADRSVQGHVNRHAGTQKRGLFQEVSRSDGDEAPHPVSPTPSPSQQAIRSELEEVVAKALAMLPPDYREVLRLHRESEASLRDVAAKMGRSHEATKKLHGRAMLQFAEHFDRLRREQT